jgi:hypothetical protein
MISDSARELRPLLTHLHPGLHLLLVELQETTRLPRKHIFYCFHHSGHPEC